MRLGNFNTGIRRSKNMLEGNRKKYGGIQGEVALFLSNESLTYIYIRSHSLMILNISTSIRVFDASP